MEPRRQVEREQPQASKEPTPWRVEGQRKPEAGRARPPWRGRGFWIVLIALLAVNYVVGAVTAPGTGRVSVPYSFFRAQVKDGNVADVESKGDEIQGSFRKAVRYPQSEEGKEVERFDSVRPSLGDDGLLTLLLDKGVSVNAKPLQQGRPWWETVLVGFGPTLLLVGLFVLFARRAASSAGGLSGLGRSRAKRYEHSEQRTTFADVAGIDEVKEELPRSSSSSASRSATGNWARRSRRGCC
jgi:cell division protease FtsH